MLDPKLEDAIKGLLGLRISDDLCRDLAKLETIAADLEFTRIANELHIAHEHAHNAIRMCVNENEEISEALDEELRDARKSFQDFIGEVRKQF
jgi:hypothetical protein